MSDANMPTFLTCLVLNVSGRKLVLPNTSVAEIVPFRHIEKLARAPQWLAGKIEWRGLHLPVLSYAELADCYDDAEPSDRVVILNALGKRDDFRFFAMAISGIPSALRVDASLAADMQAELESFELQAVRLAQGQAAYIPDLASLEDLLLSADIQG